MHKNNDIKSKYPLYTSNKKTLGFTLIELLVAVAIVGILAAIAYPSYTSFVTESNRTEGQRELLRYANMQEQYFVDYRTYGTNMIALGETTNTIDTEHKKYKISVASANATGFVLNGTAQGAQATNDSACTPLTINHVGAKGPAGCWD
ncbi:MAG: type IV pilin protein [Cognaticolwellia sp.]|jgi:type IV pilus assembly protein PilE